MGKLLVQPDGKILVQTAFNAYTPSVTPVLRLTRYNTDGSPDLGFGNQGVLIVASGGSIISSGGLALAPDGSIVVSYETTIPLIQRYSPAGVIDTSFGTGGTVSFFSYVGSLAVQPDGKILATTGSDIYRFNTDGNFDSTFGDGGDGFVFVNGYFIGLSGSYLTPSGKIVAGGIATNASTSISNPIVVQFNANGTLDTTFGTGGITITSVPNFVSDSSFFPDQFIREPNGKLLVDGLYRKHSTDPLQAIFFQYTAGGLLDATFGTAGVAIVAGVGFTGGLVGQSDGKILFGASLNQGQGPQAVVRLNPTGAIDTTFGVAGISSMPKSASIAEYVAIAVDGDVLFSASEGFMTPVTYKLRSQPFTVIVGPPTATFFASPQVGEGSAATASFTNLSQINGVTFSYDFDNDGVFEITNSPATSASVPASYLADGPAARVIHGRITRATGFTDYTASITVNNVAPSVTFGAMPINLIEGSPVTVTVSANDASAADVAAGFVFNWTIARSGNTFATGTGSSFTFTPDDNGSYVISVTATDKDGGKSVAAGGTAVVANVAPTATFGNDGPVGHGSVGSVSFTNVVDVSADRAGLQYSYDFNNDGVFDVTNSTAAAATVAASFLATNGNHIIRGRIKDKDGGFTDYTTTIVVTNPPPTASFTATASVPEGSIATAAFTNVAGVSPFTYSYDFDNDGTFEVVNSSLVTATVPAQYLADGPATRVIRGRVTAADGVFSDYTASIAVTNAKPTVTLGTLPASIAEGASPTFTASASDVSADSAAGFAFNWTLSRSGVTVATATGAPVSFPFNDSGIYILSVTATDKDGGVSTAAAVTLQVANLAPTAVFTGATVSEGTSASVTFSDANDAAGDLAAGLLYSYDFNHDGVFDIINSSVASAILPAALTADGPVARIVAGRIQDKDGSFTDYTATVTVTNLPPVISIAGAPLAPVNEGSIVTLSAQVLDVPTDISGATYAWSVTRDGITVASSSSSTFPLVISDNGNYVVSLVVTDKDGAQSTPATAPR